MYICNYGIIFFSAKVGKSKKRSKAETAKLKKAAERKGMRDALSASRDSLDSALSGKEVRFSLCFHGVLSLLTAVQSALEISSGLCRQRRCNRWWLSKGGDWSTGAVEYCFEGCFTWCFENTGEGCNRKAG